MRSSEKKTKSAGEQWAIVAPRIVPDWEAVHIFLEVARCGSFRAAAQKLRLSVNALRRRIDEFERELGLPVLTRHVNGVQPTEEGAKIYNAALQMESASFDLLQARDLSDKQVEGEVRLSITEGLGTAWLLPQLAEFQRANPRLTMNLRCGQKPADLLRLEADISVQLDRPKEPDLKVTKLGRLHLMFFASKAYLEAHGLPKSIDDFAKHRLAVLADDERKWQEAYENIFRGISPGGLVSIRNNVSTAHFSSIARGIGIGALPTYVQAIGAKLVPLDIVIADKHDIWLAYRSDTKRIARVRRVIDWIIQAFDPRRFPWFRDEFIHPDRFPDVYKGEPLTSALADLVPFL
jgi:DNA-binding transcriptional LysR family regulator